MSCLLFFFSFLYVFLHTPAPDCTLAIKQLGLIYRRAVEKMQVTKSAPGPALTATTDPQHHWNTSSALVQGQQQ